VIHLSNVDVSIVVPCYNEEQILEKSISEIKKTMDATKYSYEIILIDDKSRDNTKEIIKKLAAKDRKIKAFYHKNNRGRGATVKEGFRKAQGKVVGFIDIDLEVHCRYIPSIVQAIEEGYDAAIAWRFYKINLKSIHRVILSKGYHFLEKLLLKLPFQDTEAGFKFFNRKKILPLIEESEDNRWFFDTEIMALCYFHGLRVKEIPTVFMKNPESKSTVKIFSDTVKYFSSILRFRKKAKEKGYI